MNEATSTKTGDGEFVSVFAPHARSLYTYLASLLVNSADTDEVFQDTCCLLWTKFSSYDRSRDFGAWARGIAYLEVCNFRRRAKRPLVLGEDVVDLLAEDAAAATSSNERELALDACLRKLSEHDAQLIRMRYYDQHSPKRISTVMGNSLHAVYRSLARVHEKLLQCIETTLRRSEDDVKRITT
jgi:RNA polymerase sigma-70 factor (ECF subfamily)